MLLILKMSGGEGGILFCQFDKAVENEADNEICPLHSRVFGSLRLIELYGLVQPCINEKTQERVTNVSHVGCERPVPMGRP